jgi:hypothetical protein
VIKDSKDALRLADGKRVIESRSKVYEKGRGSEYTYADGEGGVSRSCSLHDEDRSPNERCEQPYGVT